MAVKLTRELSAALKAAGILLPYPAEDGKKPTRPLPPHCVLLAGPPGPRWDVSIPSWHPTRLNVLKAAHWAKEGRLKYADACLIGAALRAAGVTRARGKRRVTLVIVLGKGQRGGDGDCYWKSLLDGLVRCGALRDDNRQHCETMPVIYERQPVMYTRIILEDLT